MERTKFWVGPKNVKPFLGAAYTPNHQGAGDRKQVSDATMVDSYPSSMQDLPARMGYLGTHGRVPYGHRDWRIRVVGPRVTDWVLTATGTGRDISTVHGTERITRN